MGQEDVHSKLQAGTRVVCGKTLENPSEGVVCRTGEVGVVVETPMDHNHPYLIKLMNGRKVSMNRAHLSLLANFKNGDAPDNLSEDHLWDHVIYRCVTGSRAYGLDGPQSDIDRRGVYLPPAEAQWSLFGVPEQLENKEDDECYWELAKFLKLALKANPNILECLYSPMVEHANPIARELLSLREMFLSKLAYQTYNGYVASQFNKLNNARMKTGVITWKHAMHLIRLLLSGVTLLKEGYVQVRVEEYRATLLEIRQGQVPWEEVDAWRLALHKDFDQAYENSKLPERPNVAAANNFLIEARRQKART